MKELKKKLALPRLEQLRQRIALYFHLTPLSREDTIAYIKHRLQIAGTPEGHRLFTDQALEMVDMP